MNMELSRWLSLDRLRVATQPKTVTLIFWSNSQDRLD